MIRIHFSVKTKHGEDKETLGKISSIGVHFIHQPNIKLGVVRLTPLKYDTFKRLNNNQLVITSDGLGIIKNCDIKRDETGNVIIPVGVNVRVRNLNKNKIFYNLGHLNVVDIIDNETGDKYPAVDVDYPYLLIDDAPVEFVVNKKGKAMLSLNSRRKLQDLKLFTKKVNGIKLLNLLIDKGIWTPIKK